MESKWRYNIPDLAMVGSGWRLCARLVEDPDVVIVQVQGSPNQKYQLFFVGVPGQLPTALTPEIPVLGHFPYGELVEPD